MSIDMTRDDINALCAALPGATWADPSEGQLASWKVGGKMFACLAGENAGVAVKTDSIETAQMLIDAGAGIKARYFHRSWINLPFEATDPDEARHRIQVSYDLIFGKLPKATRTAIPAKG